MTVPRYGMFNRPPGFATLPAGLVYRVEARPHAGEAHHEAARHGVLVSERELSPSELLGFEIVVLVDEGSLAWHAARLVEERLAEYADEYLASAVEDPELFSRGVLDAASRSGDGVMYSLCDSRKFVDAVIAALKGRAGDVGR